MALNTDVWDRIAGRRGGVADVDVVRYAPDIADESELRLCGDVSGKRVLDLGCGAGENAIAFSKQGAHVIALDVSRAQLALGRKLADAAEVRVEWHESDVCDLAFLRADSIDLAFAAGVLGEVDDIDRVLPSGAPRAAARLPVHLLVRPPDGARRRPRGSTRRARSPLGSLEVRRSYFEPGPVDVVRDDEVIQVLPRTIADVFAALHRAGYRVDVLLEPEPMSASDPGPSIPTTIVWRARKEGV